MKLSKRVGHLARPLAVALALSVIPAATVVTAPATNATVCQAEWGSLVKKRPAYTGKQITNIRSGQHMCFDRLVFDINGNGEGRPGFHVKYVKRVRADGSGTIVPVRGGARLRVIVRAPAYDPETGEATYTPANKKELVDVTGYRTFRQVRWAGTFEGQTTVALGVRARLPMRAFVLKSPNGGHRVVVDVAHKWY